VTFEIVASLQTSACCQDIIVLENERHAHHDMF